MSREASPFCGCLYYSANALGRTITRMAEEEFAITGLSPSHAFLLMTVNNRPDVQPGEIARKMMLTPSTITRLIEKLEFQGYLTRTTEGRSTRVRPTDKSTGLNAKISEAWRNLYKRYTDLLGEETAKLLTQNTYQAAMTLEAAPQPENA